MKRKLDLTYIIFFFLIISLPLLSMVAGIEVKNSEKRQLSQCPELIEEGVLNTEFPRDFDTYFSENFGLRPLLITGYGGLNYYLLGHSVNDQVVAGKSGWLYFDKTLPDYTGENIMSEYEIEKLVRIIQIQSDWLKQKGIKFVFMPVPNKNTIYPEYMPRRYGEKAVTNIELLNKAFADTDINYINLVDLYSRVEDDIVYQKKDTPWNGTGAIIALEEILDVMGVSDLSLSSYIVERKIRTGDLGNMLLPSAGMTDTQPVIEMEKKYQPIGKMRTLEDLTIETKSDGMDRDVLMFRDSFANTLIPVMSNLFEFCYYSRSVPYDYRILESRDFDVVISEIVERNLTDLIHNVPIMPAQPLKDPDFKNSEAIDQKMIIQIEQEQGLTKISGFIPGLLSNEIYIEADQKIYAAFPVLTEQMQERYYDENGSGFTLFLNHPISNDTVIKGFIRYQDNIVSIQSSSN